MGARSGGGAAAIGAGDGAGYATAPFEGAARVRDLKPGDVLTMSSGTEVTVERVGKPQNGKVFIQMKFPSGRTSNEDYGVNKYVAARKTGDSRNAYQGFTDIQTKAADYISRTTGRSPREAARWIRQYGRLAANRLGMDYGEKVGYRKYANEIMSFASF